MEDWLYVLKRESEKRRGWGVLGGGGWGCQEGLDFDVVLEAGVGLLAPVEVLTHIAHA